MRVGLTGGIACGKSLVAGFLREMGAVVVDDDQAARDAVAGWVKGRPASDLPFDSIICMFDIIGRTDRPSFLLYPFTKRVCLARNETCGHTFEAFQDSWICCL